MHKDTDIYKTRLESLLRDVTDELHTIGILDPENEKDWVAVPESPADDADPNIVADAQEEYNERTALVALLETRFNDINRALKKIETGTYGVCEICGGTIEEKRLDAYPAARTDIAHLNEENTLPL